MIYLFDNELNMVKVATSKNVISAVHEHELNGLILGTVETDLSYTEAFINDVDYFGYYYKDNYYLHKIKRVEHEHENELVRITGRHIFFEDMLYGDYIRDVRPVNRDALYILNQTISANTRWQTVMTDTSKLHSETYYWVPPMEVLNDLTENVGIEYEPKILFDGQKINGFQLHVANRIGEDTPIRVPFGSRVLNLKYEVDYSEIVTALYGHGKGEEVGDGYGRRINFSSVNFSRNGVVSPTGQLYMENPNVTAQYGKDDGSPKFGRIIFEDIESASELANATYEAYLEQSRPKMLFEASVVDLGDVGMGDGVLIIRREYDVYFNARIHKLMVDLLDAENADVELGDYAHFKESKVQRKTRESNNQYRRETSSRIQQLKEQFNERFDGEVNQMREDFEQALIDAHAEIQAAEVRMEALINTTRTDWTDTFNAEVAEIYRKANEDYNRIETEITGVIDSTRSEMETNFNSKVNDARTYAEQQAQEKANVVRTDLETVTSGHQSMLDALETNVMNIDDFIGPRDRTLQSILDEQRAEIEQKIEVYNKNYPNLVVGSTLENIDGFEPFQTTEFELRTNESLNYIRTYDVEGRNTLAYYFPDTVYLEQGNTYTIGVDFRSDSVEDLDYIYFMGPHNNVALTPLAQTRGLTADGTWHRYYFTFDWVDTTRHARFMIGTLLSQGSTQRGWFDTRQVHIYKGNAHNIPWTPSPSDNAQVVSQLLYEMRQLEDGMSALATKTEVDLLTGNVTQLTNEYQSTSEQVSSKLQNLDDVLGVNGSHFTQIAEQVQSKVWMNDVTDINPNLIPFADVRNLSDMTEYWNRFGNNLSGSHATTLDSDGFYVFRDTVAETNLALESSTFEEINEGEHYTLSFLAKTHSNINDDYSYTYIINPSGSNHHLGLWTNRKHIRDNIYLYEWTFEARWTGEARVLIGSTTTPGTDARIRFKEPKLERGNVRTPFLNAFSNIEQLANKISLQVQDMDGTYLRHSEIDIRPEYVQLGSQRFDGDTVGSLLRVSPSGIDAIASAMRLSGDLYVDGDITALAVDAIEGEFTRLWADEFSAITIDVDDIQGLTARFEWLYTLNANIEKLVSQNVFADGVTALVGNFVDVNAGNIVTSGLSANVIKTSHLDVDTTMVRKLFATTARIDQLITRHHYVNNVKATSIDAVYADLRSVNSEIMTSNIIKADWVEGGTALFDKVFISDAMVERLTSKSAFIRDIQAIEITANQLNINTLQNKLGSVEGGLHIYGPDGREFINNSMLRASFDVQIRPNHSSSAVRTTGLNFVTNSDSWQTFEHFYTDHKGSQLLVSWALSLQTGNSSSETIEVRTRGFGGYNPIGTKPIARTVTTSGTTYYNQVIDLGVPNYNTMQGYLEFRRDPNGTHTNNNVMARVLRVSLIN